MATAFSTLDGQQLNTLRAQAPQWVTGLLAVALAARLAWWVGDLLGAPPPGALPASAATVAPAPAAQRLNLQSLLSANLFGNASPQAGGANAPLSQAPLVLAGVVADTDPKRGLALVGSSATDVHLVKVGGTLPGGGTLAEVHRDRILINTGAGVEALLLPRQTAPAAAPAPVPVLQPPPQSLGTLLQQAPDLIPGIIRPQVVVEGGKQLGFRAYPGPNKQAFDKLGLRAGDLVTAINGTPLSDPAVGRELFANLGSAAVARVTVSRDGRPQDLSLNLAQVQADLKAAITAPAGNDP